MGPHTRVSADGTVFTAGKVYGRGKNMKKESKGRMGGRTCKGAALSLIFQVRRHQSSERVSDSARITQLQSGRTDL